MKLIRRNLSLMLALRYLNPLRTMFSVITLICLGGVALGVMVLIVVLSVMEGLQQEMEKRVLAFAPHYVLSLTDGAQRIRLSDEEVDWQDLEQKLAALPTVVSAYPQLENEAFAQSDAGRMTVHFNAVEPHNEGQVAPLQEMLREGTFDFGEGLDQECVVSASTAVSLGLAVGDSLHLTPVGSLDEVAGIYAMIQSPLQTQSDTAFMEAAQNLFDGAAEAEQGTVPEAAKQDALFNRIVSFDAAKLRESEKESLATLLTLLTEHRGAVPYTAEEQTRWQKAVQNIAALDRDREDGRAVKSISEMVMPIDLRIIGIYQPPENMPGPNVYLPLQIAQDVMGYSAEGANQVQGICLRVQDANNPGDIEAQMQALLPRLSKAEEGTEAFPLQWFIAPWTRSFEQWYKLIANERVMMSFVLSIISLIASFCIMAVMFTMSMQRKREIAVLQAMGATPGKIMGIFAWQGVIIGLLGALAGIGLALLVLYYRLELQAALASIGMDPFPMQAHGITLPAVYDPATFAYQAVQAFIMVTIAAIIPAFFVSRQDPAKALRSN
ncbi:MAG: ABC transporter permease [Akkermansia sp.]|nr:ABC transporter permease [Akkermansia sp.]